ncbi:MAG: serine/threonine protein phosphatase [Eubacteriales bacterium]|nr:serine/threonine protein phosphatase [Eubacteriales bacterium]MDD3199601.1 serine/threonine protein phosphatase [Eubacteriales bacterium]MDD4629313.1 serine/threonine protein phosphatase [Eubacteriales bacterium]
MNTRARLDSVLKKAFPVPFDDNSKFVFFGDVHRGDDSLSDEFGRNRHIYYHALNYYYQNDYTYVEVGDGDELWEHPHFEHIRSAHVSVFQMLKSFYKSNRLLMLYGNHNMQLRDPRYVKEHLYQIYDEFIDVQEDLFPNLYVHEALILKHRNTGQEIFVVHGHQGDLINDQLWRISYVLVRYIWRFLHIIGVKYAASPAKNRNKRHRIEKSYNRWNAQRDIMIICGHTHRPKFPSAGEPSYFNTGCCIHPRGITCLELMYGKIMLVTWRMHSKRDGTVYIKRTLIKGPEPIVNFRSNEERLRNMNQNDNCKKKKLFFRRDKNVDDK